MCEIKMTHLSEDKYSAWIEQDARQYFSFKI